LTPEVKKLMDEWKANWPNDTFVSDAVHAYDMPWVITQVMQKAGTLDAVTGGRRYVSDLTLPALWHGAVLRPPVMGATLRALDTTAVDDRPGVVVVRTPKMVGVIARDLATARGALGDLRAQWDVPDAPSEADLEAFLRTHPAEDADPWSRSMQRDVGDPDAALASAPLRLEATYATAYIAHAPLEPRVAVAVWDDVARLTVWTGTQTPFAVRTQVAASLDLAEESVRVIVAPTGGAFGGKHAGGVATEAAVLARQIGAPVRVAWTRREEFTAGTLRPAAVIDVAAGATTSGELTAWAFTNINSGPAALAAPYRVPNQRIAYQSAASPLSQGSYRALAATANNFARESHIDELAHRVGRDPVEYRLDILADERLGAVLTAAAERVGWASRRKGAGWGIACGLEKDGRVATAAEVRVDDGGLRVVGLVTAYECGAVVNPDTVINQIEGATVMALGGALFEAIHFTDGRITNGTFSDYRVPRIDDVPPIEVVLLDRVDLPSAGAGETPMIAVAPAIANAVFDATGRRLRSLPLRVDGPLPPGR
jgi:nicotinate dehydrogenase subunit B